MKRFTSAMAALFIAASLIAQEPAKASDTPTHTPKASTPAASSSEREIAILKIRVAIKDAQLSNSAAQVAGTAAQEAQKEAQSKVNEANDLIKSTKDKLGLGADYDWDFQTQDFLKKPSSTAVPTKK